MPPPPPDCVHSSLEGPQSVSNLQRMANPQSPESDTRGTVASSRLRRAWSSLDGCSSSLGCSCPGIPRRTSCTSSATERLWMWAAPPCCALHRRHRRHGGVRVGASSQPLRDGRSGTLTVQGEFVDPGVVTAADGGVQRVMRAELLPFRPVVARVPVDVPVTFRMTSPTCCTASKSSEQRQLTVSPGYVTRRPPPSHAGRIPGRLQPVPAGWRTI